MNIQNLEPSNIESSENAKDSWLICLDAFLQEPLTIPEHLHQQAERVFSLSEFVAKQCARHPQQLIDLVKIQRFEKVLSFQDMESILTEKLIDVGTEEQLSQALRLFRNQQMIAIYWRDLLNLASVKETCEQVSFLADICIQQANSWLYNKLTKEIGIPLNNQQPQQLVVIGMGKLGGNELNVSSDVDLIFCYPKNGEIETERKNFTHEKFFNFLSRQLIKVLDQVTAEGFVFRVDMRLRPYGDSGPLVMSFSALEEYYQDQGRDWERFALIKARFITGNKQDKQHLHGLLSPFVFRRYIDYSVLESPRQMKNLINQELRRRNLADNIKLGPGGIREVEFIAQAIQLIHGGREPSLQCRSLFDSMPRIAELGLLDKTIVNELMECYFFLRKVEHRLQAYKDQQTQVLPTDEIEKHYLAKGLNFVDWNECREAIANCMEKIHQQFSTLFHDHHEEDNKTKIELIFQDIWQDFNSMETNVESILKQAGFNEVENIAEQLKSFNVSSAVRHMGPRGAKRLDQLMPAILQTLVGFEKPAESLKRILQLLSSVSRRTAYLELLSENKGALQQTIKLCSQSARIAEQIADYPYVLDELLNPNTLFHPPEISQFPDMLRQLLCRIPEDDPEQQMDCLREFRQINLLRVSAADIAGALTIRQVSRYLTAIAETVIEAVVKIAWQQLIVKHGLPAVVREGAEAEQIVRNQVQGFAIIAYGKLGGLELGYGSDLDLVFIHNAQKAKTDGSKPIESGIFYMRLAQKIIHLLSLRTRSGVLYEVDMRLRPSGNSGMLVSHIDAFTEYQEESAWTWEHQALIRTRCILGSTSLREQFETIRAAIIGRQRDDTELRKQVSLMREKMRTSLLDESLDKKAKYNVKQSKGGIADIEFITQYLVLKFASIEPNLAISSNTSELLSFLARTEKVSIPSLKELVPIYAELRRLGNNNALQNKDSSITKKDLEGLNINLVNGLWDDLFN